MPLYMFEKVRMLLEWVGALWSGKSFFLWGLIKRFILKLSARDQGLTAKTCCAEVNRIDYQTDGF